ncbi:hypothetical protein CR513_34751, partial [Mucuna pruriens]
MGGIETIWPNKSISAQKKLSRPDQLLPSQAQLCELSHSKRSMQHRKDHLGGPSARFKGLLNSYFYPLPFTLHLLALALIPLWYTVSLSGVPLNRRGKGINVRLGQSEPSKIESSLTLSCLTVSMSILSRDRVGYSLAKSSSDLLHALDPEIEITLRRLRKVRSTVVSNSSSSYSTSNSASNSNNSISLTNNSDFSECNSSNINLGCNFCPNKAQEP